MRANDIVLRIDREIRCLPGRTVTEASKQEVAYCLTVTTKRRDMLYVLEGGGLVTNSIFAVR